MGLVAKACLVPVMGTSRHGRNGYDSVMVRTRMRSRTAKRLALGEADGQGLVTAHEVGFDQTRLPGQFDAGQMR